MMVTRKQMAVVMIGLSMAGFCFAQDYDANDFAVEVVTYNDANAGSYNNPNAAVGSPSIDTDYYGTHRPVVPVYQPWRIDQTNQIVRIGNGGCLIVKFNHNVSDDRNNPYGIDFIVYGNAHHVITDEQSWDYQDPGTAILTGGVYAEPAVVWVSQYGGDDPNDWYKFDNTVADSFAPTLGRVYDTNNPVEAYPGWENNWWGAATDPTLPLDPGLQASDFNGKSLAYMCEKYGQSAGGVGFDIRGLSSEDYNALDYDPSTGEKWIRYVKFTCADVSGALTPEIDAIADAAGCGDYKHPFPIGDLDKNCRVDLVDLAMLTENWLYCTWKCQ
ncbi:MAG: hypothetical protein WC770_10260 [Phycisphaerae bacterium]|jgi:hypothetical protein